MHVADAFADDLPRRTFLEEDEEEAAVNSERNLTPPFVLLNKELVTTTPELLIVGCSTSACLVLERVTSNLKIVGSVLLPETSLEGNTVQPSLTDNSAWIWSNKEGSLLIIPCQAPVSAERSVAWVKGLLSAIQPAQLLVFGSMKAAQFRGHQDPADQTLVYNVMTHTAHGSPLAKSCHAPLLPSGNLISGLESALLQYTELRSKCGLACISVDFYAHHDLNILQHFAQILSTLLPAHSVTLPEGAMCFKGSGTVRSEVLYS